MAMLLVAYATGWILASPVIFRSTPLAVVIGVLGFLLGGWGERTFAWEDTDIMPASPTNKKLVTRGPFRYTQSDVFGTRHDGARLRPLFRHASVLRRPRAAVPLVQFLLHPLRGSQDAAPVRRSVHGLPPPRPAVGVGQRWSSIPSDIPLEIMT